VADFDPRQLDQLEDALESLEHIDDLESLELSPALTERLAEYQDVLALCREAFPVAEPRADLLADVLAEAHAVSRRAKPREGDGARWRSFWARWRGVLVPGVALAGTAAAVLLLLEPNQELVGSSARLSDEQRSDKAEELGNEADSTPSEPANMARSDEQDLDEPEPASEDIEPPTPSEPISVPGSESGSGSGSSGVSKKSKPRIGKDIASASKPTPEPAPAPLGKDETWTALDRANADRRKGDCDRARSRYEEIIAAGSDTVAVARAKAGIGLCLEQDRRTAEADQWFEQARSASAGIDTWIEKQRDEQPQPGETKKPKSKALPANADSL
jgi:tetratricopeptide (TPR) repeat protein